MEEYSNEEKQTLIFSKLISLIKRTRNCPARPPRVHHGSTSPDINTNERFSLSSRTNILERVLFSIRRCLSYESNEDILNKDQLLNSCQECKNIFHRVMHDYEWKEVFSIN